MLTTFMDDFTSIQFTDPQSGMAIGTITDGLLENLFLIAVDREAMLGSMGPTLKLWQDGLSL